MATINTSKIVRMFTGGLSALALSGVVLLSSCGKGTGVPGSGSVSKRDKEVVQSNVQDDASGKGGPREVLTRILTVAGIRPLGDNGEIEVFFNENAQFFTVTDQALISAIKDALATSKPLKVTYDPWAGELVKLAEPTSQEMQGEVARAAAPVTGKAIKMDLSTMTDDVINQPAEMGILNTTDPGLNNLIPDFTTAQLMFDYITRQCCALPGPYGIDYCISFQYCQDGCYARAHKMCWIINNKYKYGTKKIFSFANAGSDKLCVQAQKWGGCCIRWWYHVAPLVTVQTPTGPKAYVFDPAMFNQPVLLATWLKAQENPICAAGFTPHVTMINVQPNSSYTPSGSSGMMFNTDPTYSSTNSVLSLYSPRITCP